MTKQPTYITYTTSDDNAITIDASEFNAPIISHTYTNRQGVIAFGNTLTSIGSYAFYDRTSLTRVTIPDSVTSIGERAFSGCTGLKRVYITDIAAWCKITFGDYSANPLYYAKKLYLNGELVTNLVIPDSVTSIGNYAFDGCIGLTSVTIPDSVTSIGNSAFYLCTELTSVTIPGSVTSIGSSAFNSCTGLTSVTIGNGVTSIGDLALNGCSGLTSVTIGNGVTSIGNLALNGCSGLTSIYCKPTTPPTLGTGVFDDIASKANIYVPNASVEAYKTANDWSKYSSKIVGYDF